MMHLLAGLHYDKRSLFWTKHRLREIAMQLSFSFFGSGQFDQTGCSVVVGACGSVPCTQGYGAPQALTMERT